MGKKLQLIIILLLLVNGCTGLSQKDLILISGRKVATLLPDAGIFEIRNRFGTVKIKYISELVRSVNWGKGDVEIYLEKINWQRYKFEICDFIQSGYEKQAFGFLGKGGITRVNYNEETLIFKNSQARNDCINWPYHKNIDTQKYQNNIIASLYFVFSREEVNITIEKLEIESELYKPNQ